MSQSTRANSRSTSPHALSGAETPLTECSDSQYGSNDVAIIGIACRVAGDNDSPEKLWQTILEQKDNSGEIPPMRWEPYVRRDARNAKVLEKATSRGYFLDNISGFDTQFFGISPKEAEQMDPQQRISLEVVWEALERAGIPPQSLSGSDTSVFWGVNSDDYSKLILEDLPNIEAWMGIGTAYCGVPNRISYQLNLMGPSTAVDAACASSLVAIHHGRQSIVLRESTIAIVGGVNALCGPGLTAVLDKAGAVSPEGRCRSFDDSANGYGRGEGAGAIILKRLDRAVRDNDNIIGVLKGSAVAQDGRTNGIMAPNAKAQEKVAKTALGVAGIDPSTVRYVEAHATSTPLGDPTELSAVASVYGKGRSMDDPCYVGSVKPNIGHLEAGAGVMGFIKAVLAMKKGIIPPQANLSTLNKKVDWENSGVCVPQQAVKWPAGETRRAAICSYGYGGTVSHAVVEEYVEEHVEESQSSAPFWKNSSSILLLSAPQEKRIALQAKTLQSWLCLEGSKCKLDSIATTLAVRRGHHDYRAAIIVDNHEEAVSMLGDIVSGSNLEWATSGRVLSSGPGTSAPVVWVFSGHGAQWKEMGRELLADPVFKDAVDSLDEVIRKEAGFSTINALQTGDFATSDRVQVLTYVMQIGLGTLLERRGVHPDAIIGHSVGEIAASVFAGALTPAEGALIVCRRAMLYKTVAGQGSMALVNRPFQEIEKELHGREDVFAAIDSSPSSCVVSGLKDSVLAAVEMWRTREIKVMMIKSDVFFHSPMLRGLVEPLKQALSGSIRPKAPRIKLYTTASTDSRKQKPRNADYWIENMINPVHLTSAVRAAVEDKHSIFMEISSHPIVSHSVNETIMDAGLEDYAVLSTLKRNAPAVKCILKSISELHCRGARVDWDKQMPGAWLSKLPTTTWSHKPIWRKIETGPLNTNLTHEVERHTLLGQRLAVAGTGTIVFNTRLDENTKPFPGNHPLHGTEIVPAAVLINTIHDATEASEITNVVLRVPVAISAPREVQIVVKDDQARIASCLALDDQKVIKQDDSWVTHTTAKWQSRRIAENQAEPTTKLDISSIRSRIGTRMKNDFSIDYLDKVGVSAMGFPWAITEHWGNRKEMLARVEVSPSTPHAESLPWDVRSWAPILDAATSVGSTLFFDEPRLRMPAQIDKVSFSTEEPPPRSGWLFVEEASDTALASHVTVAGEDGSILAKFTSMRFSEIEGTPGVSGSVESLVHQMAWPPTQLAENPRDIREILMVCEDPDATHKYREQVPKGIGFSCFPDVQTCVEAHPDQLLDKHTAIIYVPGKVETFDEIAAAIDSYICQVLDLIKHVASLASRAKVFIITDRVFSAETPNALAQGPLHGLSRIIASEQPDIFGGLIDSEDGTIPLTTMKYIHGADVIRINDGVARTALLRPLRQDKSAPVSSISSALLPKPEGTYIITGGLGALGISVAEFLVEKGARRLVLVSRRSLPPRSQWNRVSGALAGIISSIRSLESHGASVYVIAVDMGTKDASSILSQALDGLRLPPVLGVVHAAGVLEDQLVLSATPDSFHRVLAPKVGGALALHSMFPPSDALDFFVLFSSCGQLFGFPGQGSYASGNAFLDVLATHRRTLGDPNAVSFQWTSWRGMGMASSTEFINAELESKGITDVTRDEAFRAWEHVARCVAGTDHAVVLRSLAFDEGEVLPSPMLAEIAPRRAVVAETGSSSAAAAASSGTVMPPPGPELKAFLDLRIREAVAKVLQSTADDVDSRAALSDLGIDSVMTVALRRQLQSTLKVKVPPTLTWSHPTVSHLVNWFEEKATGA